MKEYGEYDRGKAGICREKYKKVYSDDKGEQGGKKKQKKKRSGKEREKRNNGRKTNTILTKTCGYHK